MIINPSVLIAGLIAQHGCLAAALSRVRPGRACTGPVDGDKLLDIVYRRDNNLSGLAAAEGFLRGTVSFALKAVQRDLAEQVGPQAHTEAGAVRVIDHAALQDGDIFFLA